MNLGVCWQDGVWADGSWVEGVWCPEVPCIPESIGQCWDVVWCSGTWQTGVWCPTSPTPPVITVRPDELHWGPSHVIYTDDPVLKRRLRDEEEIIIL